MRHSYLDRFSRLSSPIHSLSAGTKFLFLIVILLVTTTSPITSYGILGAVGLCLFTVALLSTIPMMFVVRRLVFLELFVIGITLLSLFQPNGMQIFLGLLVRSTLCLLAVVLFSNTTPFSEVVGLFRRLRVPALVVTTLALMYRYLFVFVDELERMERARSSRTVSPRQSVVWHSLGTVISQLFIRSTERAERIYSAMCARGWR